MSVMTRAVLALAAVLALPAPALAEAAWGPHVTVTGTGTAAAVPDMASLRIGVVAEAAAPGAAVDAMAERMAPVLATLAELGVAGRDVRTGQLGLRPVYADGPADGAAPRIAGYEAVNDVEVRIRDLARLGEILGAVVGGGAEGEGANRFEGLSFGLADPDPARAEALDAAVRDAADRAARAARSAGATLGALLQIAEQSEGGGPGPAMMEMRAADIPVATGEIEIRAQITMTYALGD